MFFCFYGGYESAFRWRDRLSLRADGPPSDAQLPFQFNAPCSVFIRAFRSGLGY